MSLRCKAYRGTVGRVSEGGYMAKSKLLIEDNSRQNLSAFVEECNGCVYLYLFRIREEDIVAKSWVINTKRAPKKFDLRGMKRGKPPRMIAACCDHPKGMAVTGGLSLRWTEDANTLVLSDGQGVLAVIDGVNGEAAGYARHVLGESPVAKPFEMLPDRLKESLFS